MDTAKVEIPKDTAVELCEDIRKQYQGKWWTIPGMWCLGCTLASKSDLAKRCISGAPGYRGCGLVNARYDGQTKKV